MAALTTMQAASELLHRAQTDEDLAEEVISGGLNPDLRYPDRKPMSELNDEDDDSDEVFVQIRMLLSSALSTGQLRKLARAIVLSWQAGYDSKLLRQVSLETFVCCVPYLCSTYMENISPH